MALVKKISINENLSEHIVQKCLNCRVLLSGEMKRPKAELKFYNHFKESISSLNDFKKSYLLSNSLLKVYEIETAKVNKNYPLGRKANNSHLDKLNF